MFKKIKSTNTRITKSLTIFIFAMMAIVFSSAALSVQSLRGEAALDSDANKVSKHKLNTEEGGYKRSFTLQPPMVPHKVDSYRITLSNNGCLNCHSEKAYKKEKAPRAADSHYMTRDGKKLETVSKRRYFCSQCHAPQVKSAPLVDNTYEDGK